MWCLADYHPHEPLLRCLLDGVDSRQYATPNYSLLNSHAGWGAALPISLLKATMSVVLQYKQRLRAKQSLLQANSRHPPIQPVY
jgi:hypothetical protein